MPATMQMRQWGISRKLMKEDSTEAFILSATYVMVIVEAYCGLWFVT